MRAQIDRDRCQGHGRCYTLAPTLFTEDDEGQGIVIGEGEVAESDVASAHLAEANCPENAVILEGS
jgi:ferredoxin